MKQEDLCQSTKETKNLSPTSSSKSSIRTSIPDGSQSLPSPRKSLSFFRPIGRVFLYIWHWSIIYRSANRKIDPSYVAVWKTSLDKENVRATLHAALPTVPIDVLPDEEESIRALIRTHLPPPPIPPIDEKSGGENEVAMNEQLVASRLKILQDSPEEAWEHLPMDLRALLAALNAHNLEKKVDLLLDESYHPDAGRSNLGRSARGVHKTFRMWRLGFKAGVSRFERNAVGIFFIFLAFSACYPDVAAGFLGERSYNQRSIGSRIATLCQLFSLFIFPYHSFWLLFNWSLERLIGAFVGNTTYALAAIVPVIHEAYGTSWFRFTLLGLSMSWQVGVQFTPTVRDYVVRLITRRQMSRLRAQSDTEAIDWDSVDQSISHELISNKAFIASQDLQPITSWSDVPFRTRTERFIKFTATYSLGRPSDQLIGLLKDDLELIINTYQDYTRSAPNHAPSADKGHIEPPLPKVILVIFDAAIFAYICFSFWTQPFTFNTTVAYGTVVVLKQAVLAAKRYQTAKSARRLFTNMVAFNILGIFLVSTPVTIDRDILKPTGNFIALTLAMVFATLFLSEPLAPLVLKTVEGMLRIGGKLRKRFGRRKGNSE